MYVDLQYEKLFCLEYKGVLRSFQCIVRLYQDSNLQRDEMKDDRHTLVGCEFTLANGLRFCSQLH